MFSKFSVLPKFYKHLRFHDNGWLRLFSCMAPKQRCSTKVVQSECGSNNIFWRRELTKYICEPSVMTRRKMSSNEGKGDGENPINPIKIVGENKDLGKIRKRYKGKNSKKAKANKKRRKYLTQRNLIFEEIKQEVPPSPIVKTADKKETALKTESIKINKSKDISQSELPPKKVHIEFMESSQNLKDFKLPSLQQMSPKTQKPKSPGGIKKIINPNDSSKESDIKLVLFVSETQQLTKSSQDTKNQTIKSVKTKIFKNKDLKKNNEAGKLSGESKIFKNKDLKDNNVVETQNKKIKKNNEVKSQKLETLQTKKDDPIIAKVATKPDMDKKENKSETLTTYSEPLHRPIKSVILKNVPQKRDAMKEERSWTQNNNHIKVSSKKYQPRLSKFNRSKMLEKATKQILGTIETLKNPPQPQELPLPKLVENTPDPIIQMKHSKSETNSTTGETTKGTTVLLNTPNTFMKSTSAGNIAAAAKPNSSQSGQDTVQPPKTATKISPPNRVNGGLKPTHTPKNMFGDAIPPEKLKQMEPPKITTTTARTTATTSTDNTLPQSGRPKPKKKLEGSTTKKTNKLNKFKRFGATRRRGGGGGDQGPGRGGEGGGNTFIHNIPTTPPKETPSSFWRSVSISMIPVVLAFTAYVFHNIGALEMIKNFVASTPNSEHSTLNVVPALYIKDSDIDDMESEQTELDNELQSNEYDEEQDTSDSHATNHNEPFEETYLEDLRWIDI